MKNKQVKESKLCKKIEREVSASRKQKKVGCWKCEAEKKKLKGRERKLWLFF